MRRVAAAAALGAALVASGCVGYRTRLADEALRDGQLERAFHLYRSLARHGDAESQFRVGNMLALGQGTVRREGEAIVWYRKAARHGYVDAQVRLATLYLAGKGKPAEDPDAERWMIAAAERDAPDARYRLGLAYLEGEIVLQSDQEALRWLRRAAEGWIKGTKGIDMRLDDAGLLRRTAELGLAEAQHYLGHRYYSGMGTPQNRQEAMRWYFLAANQGLVAAEITLGWAYGQGAGVPQDHVESARWFLKAANGGDAEAQYQLGLLLHRGMGMRPDHVLAHMWLNLAAAQGHEAAREKRDEVATLLSGLQIAEAERMALEWTQKHDLKAPEGGESTPEGGEPAQDSP